MKLKLTLSFLLVASSLFAQVNWQTIEWQQAKDLAKKENKNLFVDCYTDWCSWCKVMDKQTFPDAQVSKFMNDQFVSIKIDAEKGFGIDVARKYGVSGYPCYLMFNSRGDLVKISLGYQDAAPFLAMLKENTDPTSQKIISGYSQNIPIDYPPLLTKMWSDKTYKPTKEDVAGYLDSQSDHFSEQYWSVLSRFYKFDDKYFQQIDANREKYRNLFGTDAVNDIFLARLNKDFSAAIKNKNEDELNAFLKNLAAYNLPADEETQNAYRLIFYQNTGDWKKMMTQLDEYIKIHGGTDISLNEYCWAIYEGCDDEAIVKRASDIMAKVVAANPMYAEMDTYAALLYKSKQYNEAETVAVNAITKGKSENSDVSGTEALLEKIKTAKSR